MYLYHFGLRELPFTLTPNTQFFLGLPSHHEALQTLLTALKMGEGFIKVTGEVGTGKTLLCRKLMNDIPKEFVTAYIPNPYLQPDELRLAVAHELGISSEQANPAALTQLIQQALLDISAQGKTLILILDEAQVLPDESLEVLRLFTNLETESRKLIQIVLFAQPELDERLAQHNMRQIKQRVTFSFTLEALTETQVQPYLQHRMTIAGFKGMPVFSTAVSKVLYSACNGTPRILNILAHKCLMLAYGEGKREVELKHVHLAIKDSEIRQSQHQINNQKLLNKMSKLALASISLIVIILMISKFFGAL
ncbi:AAA family ATPase [Catenovulum sp. 2E275]|uniref:ExeA family protein n=1 Tax=Catenovulum sp. 2E275 TaxID=2980497 RepID=UPI0021D02D8A|nr:AAA family ATPase [Catenovulum sp. 2E275]MCU4675058.1 AAA family ATPase [Catenovulum sp. 2E275]